MTARRRSRPTPAADVVAALDIGASKALCLIAYVARGADDAPAPEVIGVGVQGAPVAEKAEGLASIEAMVRGAIDAAERMAGERLKSATVVAGGKRVLCRRIGVELEIEGGRVTEEDIADCLKEGAAAAAGEGTTPLHALAAGYGIDGDDAGRDPRGASGRVLTAEVLGVGVRDSYFADVEALLERCGLELDDMVAGPYAAGEGVLLDDEKDLGVVVIDIGAGATGYAVYESGALVDLGGAPVGAAHVTRDIAQIFGVPLREAERVKTLHGSALIGVGDEHRLVDLPLLGDSDAVIRVPRAELSSVITPRIEEIFEIVRDRLPTTLRSRAGVRRAALTGGGSLLVGARETAERILQMKTRLGRPTTLAGAPDAATAPQFSACAGALLLAARARQRGAAPALDLRADQRAASGGLLAGVGHWLRTNF